MSDQVQFGYNPNVWQERYHKSMTRHCALSGGMGCLPAGSLIDTIHGKVPIEQITSPTTLVSFSHKGLALAEGTRSFPVGLKRQCRIVHEYGELLCSDTHRLFDADYKYLPARDFSVGDSLLYLESYSHNQLSTTSGIFQLVYGVDDQHLMKTIANYLDGCLSYIHQYGPLPPLFAVVAQVLAPSLIGGKDSFGFYDQGVQNQQELERIHNHLCEVLVHLEKHGFYFRSALPVADELNFFEAESFEHILQDTQQSLLFQLNYDSHLKDFLFSQRHNDKVFCDSFGAKYKNSKILSIEIGPEVPMYDLHVVGTNNYLSQGLIHSNSGKSLAACMEHIALALEYPGSRWVVGRRTLPSLRITILKTFLNACPKEIIREFNKAQMVVTFMNGSEFIFLPLDDVEKLKSLEIAGFIIEEANEVDKDIYDRLKDRMRQMLPNGTRPRYRSTIMLNPTDEEHWIPQLFLFQKPKNHELFQSSTIENMLNLPEEYIDELKNTYSEDMLQRFLYGQFGRVHKGRPVFPTFDKNKHVKIFEYDENTTLVRGWDFGFNHPVCSWLQLKNDQVRILATLKGKRIYLDDFINGTKDFVGVRRFQEELFGPNRNTKDYCDPRGSDETDKGITSISILNRNSIFPVYRRTWIEEGLDAMKMKIDTKCRLTGEPNLIVHPRCKNLIEGFLGGYHRDEDDTPVKDNLYDNDMDSVRYPIIHMVQQAAINRQLARQDFNRAYVNPHTGRRCDY